MSDHSLDRGLPASLESERAILGATLLNKAVRLQLVGTALTGGTGTLSVRVAYRVHTGLS